MHMPKLALFVPSLMLLAVSAPAPHVYDVGRYGAKCDAVTTGAVSTSLMRSASAGAESASMASVANVVPGAQIYLDPTKGMQEIHYVRSVAANDVFFTAPLKADHAAGTRVYGSGGYVSGTDDTEKINAAFAAAARDGAGTVQFPAGKCAISGPLNANTPDLTITGAGMHQTTIVAMPTFDYNTARTPRGLDGQYVGMLWTDLPATPSSRGLSPPESPLQHVTIQNLGLDPRAGTQSGHFYKFQPITGYVRAVQYLTVRNVYFELGAPLSWTDITKPFKGIDYTVLSYDPAHASHDLVFENIEAHNGVGTIQLRQGAGGSQSPCPSAPHDRVTTIKILNEKDVVDLNDIEDDRIVITANACHPGAEMDDIQVRGQTVAISPSVMTGGANGHRNRGLERHRCGLSNTLDAHHTTGSAERLDLANANATRVRGNPFRRRLGLQIRDSGITDLVVAHLRAVNSAGVGAVLRGGPLGEPMSVTFDDLMLTNTYGNVCVRFAALSPPTGRDQVHVFNVTCSSAPEARAKVSETISPERCSSRAAVCRRTASRVTWPSATAGSSAIRGHSSFTAGADSKGSWPMALHGIVAARLSIPRRSCETRRRTEDLQLALTAPWERRR